LFFYVGCYATVLTRIEVSEANIAPKFFLLFYQKVTRKHWERLGTKFKNCKNYCQSRPTILGKKTLSVRRRLAE
jgi:hypothetical protein